MRIRTALALLCFSITGIGCAGTYQNAVNFNPAEPLRVAVLPFYRVDKEGKLLETDPNIVVLDDLPLVSRKLDDSPPEVVQKHVQTVMGKTGLDLVTPAAVDGILSHHGFVIRGMKDYERIRKFDAKKMCELLVCDALLYGEVTKWDRSYYGLQTVNTVGVKVRLVRAADGKELFSSSAEDSESRGITKIPTGISSAVLEPIKGLDNDIISNLARDVVEKMFKPLAIQNRPEFLNSFPPVILASSHTSKSGALDYKAPLTVVMLGTPKKLATFSIGKTIENIPMVEKEEGHYVGEYYPLPTDKFSKELVTVSLVDQFGRVSEQTIGVGPVTLQ